LFSKLPHIEQVANGESFHAGKGGAEVGGEAFNDPGSPALLTLADQNIPPDVVVEPDLLSICGKQRTLSSTLNALL
jgi:hypothetical protein